jgi:hypothetical protein
MHGSSAHTRVKHAALHARTCVHAAATQVLLLGTGGRTVYQGSPYAAVLYFDKHLGFKFPDRENPSDILMDIIAGKVHNDKDPK